MHNLSYHSNFYQSHLFYLSLDINLNKSKVNLNCNCLLLYNQYTFLSLLLPFPQIPLLILLENLDQVRPSIRGRRCNLMRIFYHYFQFGRYYFHLWIHILNLSYSIIIDDQFDPYITIKYRRTNNLIMNNLLCFHCNPLSCSPD